jgi:molybdate transport system substrate-binding protein
MRFHHVPRPLRNRLAALSMTVPLSLALAACGSDSTTATTTAPRGRAATVTGTVTVLAASSLTAAFTDIGKAFEQANPGTKVVLSFGASSDLVAQIGQGAPADVFASADQANMKKLSDAGKAAGAPSVFATNSLQIIVQHGNPKGIATLADLAKPGVVFVTAAPEVPIGKYAAQVLTAAKVTLTPKSLEQNVKGIVAKVTAGEADAGIVYRTDVLAAGAKADGVEIPSDVNVVATYPIAATVGAPNPSGAAAFDAFVLSPAGQQVLRTYGFAAP